MLVRRMHGLSTKMCIAKSALFFFTISTALAVNLVYDEFLWTKQVWGQVKVDNALRHTNPSDLEPKLLEVYPSITGSSSNSLDGPHERRDGSNAPDETEGLEGITGVSPIDELSHVKPASVAVECPMCHVLITKVWQRATTLAVEVLTSPPHDPTHMLRKVVGPQKGVELMEETCKEEAVDALLKSQAILRLGDPIGTMMFFVIRERGKRSQPPNSMEKKAARVACKRLVQESGMEMGHALTMNMNTMAKQLVTVFAKFKLLPALADEEGAEPDVTDPSVLAKRKHQALQVVSLVKEVVARVGQLDPSAGKGGAEDDDDDYDSDDIDPLCMDLHPLCLKWADSGECDANPAYMIGSAGSKGQCRESCGVCLPRKSGASQGSEPSVDTRELRAAHPALESDLEVMLGAMLQATRSTACSASKACLAGSTGSSMGAGFMKASGSLPVLQPTGWKLGTVFHGEASIKKMTASRAQALEEAALATPSPEPGSLAAEIDQVLSEELKGKVLSIIGDFFIFEYVYKNHTRQYHEAPNGDLTEDYILGKFQRESVNVVNATSGTAATLEELDLLPDQRILLQQKEWPYVKQVYSGGEECVLAGNRRVVRKTEVRVSCSPDKEVHMLVREPEFCHYVFVIYSPTLCAVDKFKPLTRGTRQIAVEGDDDAYI